MPESRFLVVRPLAVYFDVSEGDRTATIWSVFRF